MGFFPGRILIPLVLGATITDDTTSQSFSTDQAYDGPGQSAEWIAESTWSFANGA
jgi:hypothetical protein